ncbi:MAG: LAGLIDADG family homing endonuclease [Gammaproteobacteria bacterium]
MSASEALQVSLDDVDAGRLDQLNDDQFQALVRALIERQAADRKENQLVYYQPASAQCRKVHATRARYIGIGGGNGACLPLHAPVMMADGTYRPLGEIRVGDRVMAADPASGVAVPADVRNVFRSGRKPVYRVTFSDGGSFEATVEHQVPLYLGSGRVTSKGNPKRPEKRRLGDYLEPIMRRGATNPSKRISAVSPHDICAEGAGDIRMDPWMLGALLGDGHLGTRQIKFFSGDAEVIERAASVCEAAGGRLSSYAGRYEFGVQAPAIRAEIRRLGLEGTDSFTKFVPEAVFSMPRHQRAQVLAGLIDTDGTVDSYVSASDALAEGVARLVRSLGGKATITRRVARCQNGAETPVSAVYLRLNERLPLALPRKQRENQRGRPIDYRRRVCREAELVGVFECGDIEVDHPAHCYITGDGVIVSNSKSDTCLAEISALTTGIIPDSVPELREKFRGPINVRIVVESITTTLHNIILPKLRWNKWSGVSEPGGEKGHWGWIPMTSLIEQQWEKSWSEKTRTLRVLCRDPDNWNVVLGESTWQFMSHDQDPSDFASGDFHIILHDEPTKHAIWVENQARTMRVNGVMMLAMTWPDDPAIPVDWIFDEIYEKAQPGPMKSPHHAWIELSTRENRNLDQRSIAIQALNWNATVRATRLEGRPIRFSNRIHPLFTDSAAWWSFQAGKQIEPEYNDAGQPVCPETGSLDVVEFSHVEEFDPSRTYPTIFVLDPHPRKPHMFFWAQVTPEDDYDIVLEGELSGTTREIYEYVTSLEASYGLQIRQRIMDPNMGMQAAAASRSRETTWQEEFANDGLFCDLASDTDVGRSRINDYLQPDRYTLRPRIRFASRCEMAIWQMKRYCWDDHKRTLDRDLKQTPKTKYDDYPTMLKYLLNLRPEFRSMLQGPQVIKRSRY